MNLKEYIKNIPDFPSEGIIFRDITTLIADKDAFKYCIDEITKFANEVEAEVVIGPESRGFIFGCPVAINLKTGFIPVRKPNKLPRETEKIEYTLEYGSNVLEIHSDSIYKGQKVVIVDDLLATGGTTQATIKLIEKLGGIVVGIAFIIELDDLQGRSLLDNYKIKTLVHY